MPMKNEIKVYLESPQTLASDLGAKPEKPKRKITRKRKERLPKFFNPPQNIYLATDYSKLTERQRLMALRFQSLKDKANSLFLAVHNIDLGNDLLKSVAKDDEQNKDVPSMTDKSRNVEAKPIRKPRIAPNKKQKSQICSLCYSDVFKLFQFLSWLNQKHSCNKIKKIKLSITKIQKIVQECKCICKSEEKIYGEIEEFLETECCL